MEIRAYQPADRDGCLGVFDSNTPPFFRTEERGEFELFLDRPECPYFVMEHEGAVAGCGGYVVRPAEPDRARLVWGMVRREWHRQGLGRFLLLYRLREIAKVEGVRVVGVETSQHTAPFFARQGFKTVEVVADGYGPGLDRVEMAMRLTVCP